MSINPYASPSAAGFVTPQVSGAEAIRKQYLSHEASIKSIGALYMLGAIFLVPIGIFLFIGGFVAVAAPDAAGPGQRVVAALLGAFYFAIGILQGATAVGLRRLRPWARIVAIVISVFGLIGFPIGTLISAYFLYLLLSKKGNFVFSDEYRRVVAETPHIKYRTSIIVIILLLILIVLVIGGLVAAMLGG